MRLDANTDGPFLPIVCHDGDVCSLSWLCFYVIGGVWDGLMG
jgi:hypothetical protein